MEKKKKKTLKFSSKQKIYRIKKTKNLCFGRISGISNDPTQSYV